MRSLLVDDPNIVMKPTKETSAGLANVVNFSGMYEIIPVDVGGNTLTSEIIVHNFLQFIRNAGSPIETRILQVLA